jgi:hypothetical protein
MRHRVPRAIRRASLRTLISLEGFIKEEANQAKEGGELYGEEFAEKEAPVLRSLSRILKKEIKRRLR